MHISNSFSKDFRVGVYLCSKNSALTNISGHTEAVCQSPCWSHACQQIFFSYRPMSLGNGCQRRFNPCKFKPRKMLVFTGPWDFFDLFAAMGYGLVLTNKIIELINDMRAMSVWAVVLDLQKRNRYRLVHMKQPGNSELVMSE